MCFWATGCLHPGCHCVFTISTNSTVTISTDTFSTVFYCSCGLPGSQFCVVWEGSAAEEGAAIVCVLISLSTWLRPGGGRQERREERGGRRGGRRVGEEERRER